MEIIDKAVQSMVTLVGTWIPVVSLKTRETVYFNDSILTFFKERARASLALRDDIPDVIKKDLTTFDTRHIDSIIFLYSLEIGHLPPAERAQASKGRDDLTSIIMEEYLILAYELYVEDKADAVTESICKDDIIDMLPVRPTSQCCIPSSNRSVRSMSQCC
jgi:hypothetical protein